MTAEEAVRQTERTVYRLAARIDPNGYGRDDLIQEGFVGALLALRAYDPTSGVPFRAYAELRIRGAMVDSLRRVRKRSEVRRDAGHRRELVEEPAVEGDERLVDDADEVEAALRLVRDALPPPLRRAVLSMFGVGGRLSEGQLCERLSVPTWAVRWARERGLEVLRERARAGSPSPTGTGPAAAPAAGGRT